MGKLLLMSIMFAAVAIPARVAREGSAKKGFRKTILYTLAFNLWYFFFLMFLHGRL